MLEENNNHNFHCKFGIFYAHNISLCWLYIFSSQFIDTPAHYYILLVKCIHVYIVQFCLTFYASTQSVPHKIKLDLVL